MQDAYEQLQDELREAVGDAAYWRELAEARGEGCAEPLKARGSEAGASHNKVATPPAPSEEVELPCVEDIEKQQVEPGSRQALRLEMLKDAQTQVLRWRRLAEQRGEELERLRNKEQAHLQSNSPTGHTSPGSARDGARWPGGSFASNRFAHTSPIGLSRNFAARSPHSRISPRLHQTPPRSPATPSAASKRPCTRPVEAVADQVPGCSVSESAPAEREATSAAPSESEPESPARSAISGSSRHSQPLAASVSATLGRTSSEPRGLATGGSAAAAALRRSSAKFGGGNALSSEEGSDRAPSAAVAALSAAPTEVSPATNRRILFANAVPAREKEGSSSSNSSVCSVPTPARAWGPGSAPRRCVGLGLPTRRKPERKEAPHCVQSPSAAADMSQGAVLTRPRTSNCMAMSPSAKAARRGTVSLGQPSRRSSMLPTGGPDFVSNGLSFDSPRMGCQTPPHPASGTRTPPCGFPPFRPPPCSFGSPSANFKGFQGPRVENATVENGEAEVARSPGCRSPA